MFLLIDNIIVRILAMSIYIASLWNLKAKLWRRGRNNLLNRVKQALKDNQKQVIWMHSASLGEFEQGRILLENLRARYPGYCVVITFFSPSGYEVVKNYKGADHIFYLPLPTRANAKKFIELLDPALVLWIKYDYWYHYLHELKKRRTPLLLVSAIFHRKNSFFKWYGKLYRRMLDFFTWLFVQDESSEKRLKEIGLSNVSVSGDTRFDRVIDIEKHFQPVPQIEAFTAGRQVLVAGSTWPEDEEELDHFANTHPEMRFIIAPHEIDETHVKSIEKLFHFAARYSAFAEGKVEGTVNTLIIDNIGMLSRLYKYATVTYVGGGFGNDGVHNVLEAAVYGKPVIFGPVFNQFREAIDLLEEGAAFTVENALDLEKTLNILLTDAAIYKECANAAREYVQRQRGATERIIRYIQENRLLIS